MVNGGAREGTPAHARERERMRERESEGERGKRVERRREGGREREKEREKRRERERDVCYSCCEAQFGVVSERWLEREKGLELVNGGSRATTYQRQTPLSPTNHYSPTPNSSKNQHHSVKPFTTAIPQNP